MYGSEDWLPGEDEIARKAMWAAAAGSTDELHEYAAWLEANGDSTRAEVLRTELALHADPDGPDATAHAILLESLVASVNPEWWKTFSRGSWVYNCGQVEGGGKVRFSFECSRTWETLERTGDDGARRCRGCDSLVYLCDTAEQAEDRARAGQCISIRANLAYSIYADVTRMVTGRPVFRDKWADRIFRS